MKPDSAIESAPDAPSDGRVQRGKRSRERILDALLELVREGFLRPTAEQVARRAGVGIRTVFRRFADMDGLFAELDARTSAIARELYPPASGPSDAPLPERIGELVGLRISLYEELGPFLRSSVLHRARSAYVEKRSLRSARELRRDVEARIPELSDEPDWVADAVDTLLSFESWNRLRHDRRLGRERIRLTLRASLTALLAQRDRP